MDEDEAPISLISYDPRWPDLFQAEKGRLEEVVGPWVSGGIEHVGSTSVPGLAAKPIIDIMVGVEDLEAARGAFGGLAELGYLHAPYKQEIMHWFCKPSVKKRTHHLYLMEWDSSEWKARIAFRDYLRIHPYTAQAYEQLKRGLARRFEHDRESYTDAKGNFVRKVVSTALRANPPPSPRV